MPVADSLRLPASVRQHVFATGAQTARALAMAVAANLQQGLKRRSRASLAIGTTTTSRLPFSTGWACSLSVTCLPALPSSAS